MADDIDSTGISIINLSQYTNELIEFIQDYWYSIAPKAVYEKSIPEKVLIQQENTLIINTSWPVWAQEIEWNKQEILDKVNKSFNLLQFQIDNIKSKIISEKELVYKIQEIKNRKQSREDSKVSTKLDLLMMNQGEISEEITHSIHSIADERIRKSLIELAKYLK